MTHHFHILFQLAVVIVAVGCGGRTDFGPLEDGGSADGDSDGDGDGDADGDGDGDADSDADGDGDADADADGDSDTDVDADSDTDSDGDSDTDGDSDADGDSDSDTDTDPEILCEAPLQHDDHTYRYCTTPVTAVDAQIHCESLGAHLVTILDRSENVLVQDMISSDAWIGASDATSEGWWQWVTGENWVVFPWSPGEPNNSGNQDCAVIQLDGLWSDVNCEQTRSFVCESEKVYRESLIWSCLICDDAPIVVEGNLNTF